MSEYDFRFPMPAPAADEIVDLRDSLEHGVFAQAGDMAESLLAYIHHVRTGREAASPATAREVIASKARAIDELVSQEHERTP